MKSLFHIGIFITFHFHLSAQSDSIKYFNEYWKETTKDSSLFYRVITKRDDLHHVKDYFNSGKLQMEGDYSSLEPEIQEGYFTWYFENGQKFVEGNFTHGLREGVWTFWYPDGLKKEEIKFLPGKEEEYSIRWQSKREKNTLALIEKALRKKNNGKLHDSEMLLNTAIEINPYSADAYYERGLIQCESNRKQSGCDDLRKAKDYGFFDNSAVNEAIEENCQ